MRAMYTERVRKVQMFLYYLDVPVRWYIVRDRAEGGTGEARTPPSLPHPPTHTHTFCEKYFHRIILVGYK